MQDFDYVAPSSLKEAIAVLARQKGKACCLAGGTDLIDQVRSERRTPSTVVDVKGIPELNRLSYSRTGGLRIGAAVPCATVYDHPSVRELYPIIVEATSLVGDVKIQNRAGIGGNLCNAAPSADTAPAMLVLDANCVVAGPKGSRRVPIARFFAGPGRTTMAADELLVEIAVPPPKPNSAGGYQRLIPRNEMDIAVVGVGAYVSTTGPGRRTVREARIALASVAPTPVRAARAESYLKGRELDQESVSTAAERAALSAKPISDMRGSADYRREMVKALTRKVLTGCAAALGSGMREAA